MKTITRLLAVLAVVGWSGSANASLIGQVITCSAVNLGGPCDPESAEVGAGVEFALQLFSSGFAWNVDVGDSSVLLTFVDVGASGNPPISTITLGDLFWSNDPSAEILGISNFSTDATSGIVETDISTQTNSLTIDLGDSFWNSGEFLSFELLTSHDIPIPTTLALFGLGLAGLGFSRRRKV